jgi:hypothetical protein
MVLIFRPTGTPVLYPKCDSVRQDFNIPYNKTFYANQTNYLIKTNPYSVHEGKATHRTSSARGSEVAEKKQRKRLGSTD